MLLRSTGEACTRIADETAAIMADVTKSICPKKFKGVWAVKEWWGTSGRKEVKEQRVYRQDE